MPLPLPLPLGLGVLPVRTRPEGLMLFLGVSDFDCDRDSTTFLYSSHDKCIYEQLGLVQTPLEANSVHMPFKVGLVLLPGDEDRPRFPFPLPLLLLRDRLRSWLPDVSFALNAPGSDPRSLSPITLESFLVDMFSHHENELLITLLFVIIDCILFIESVGPMKLLR